MFKRKPKREYVIRREYNFERDFQVCQQYYNARIYKERDVVEIAKLCTYDPRIMRVILTDTEGRGYYEFNRKPPLFWQ